MTDRGASIAASARTRTIRSTDAEVLAAILARDRAFFAPWDAVRADDFFTAAGQREDIAMALLRRGQGLIEPRVILDDGGDVVGRITLNSIVRGAFQSGTVGYWLAADANGRGLATGALRELAAVAFDELGLHRLEAGTLVHNERSQAVLRRCGFTRYGLAPRYIRIAGIWQDHVLFQRLADDPDGPDA